MGKIRDEWFKMAKTKKSGGSLASATAFAAAQTHLRGVVSDVRIAADRPPTLLGVQGDHVSAYALFKECVYTAVLGLPIKDALNQMLHMIDSYAGEHPQVQAIFENAKAKISGPPFLNNDQIQKIRDGLHSSEDLETQNLAFVTAEALNLANTSILESVLNDTIATHFTFRNKLNMASFPEEGNKAPTPGEAQRVKTAIKQLAKFKDNPPTHGDVQISVSAIIDLLHYPKIPDNLLLSPVSKKWEAICQKKYTKDTLPRDNDVTKLKEVMKNHVELLFACFPGLHAQREAILEDFTTNMAAQWKIKGVENDIFKQAVIEIYERSFHDHIHSASSQETPMPDRSITDSGPGSPSGMGGEDRTYEIRDTESMRSGYFRVSARLKQRKESDLEKNQQRK